MRKHNHTPWVYHQEGPHDYIKTSGGLCLAKMMRYPVHEEEVIANAERIVACVNAIPNNVEDPKGYIDMLHEALKKAGQVTLENERLHRELAQLRNSIQANEGGKS